MNNKFLIKKLLKILFSRTIIFPEFVGNFSSKILSFQTVLPCIHSTFIFFVIFRVLLDIRHSISSSKLASCFVDFPPPLAIPTIISRACIRTLYKVLLRRLPYIHTRFRINVEREYSLERNNRVPNS